MSDLPETVWTADLLEQRAIEAEGRIEIGRGVGDIDGPTWLDLQGG